jgi:hypothetical protein
MDVWPPLGAVPTQVRPFPCQRSIDGVADVVSVPGEIITFGHVREDTP